MKRQENTAAISKGLEIILPKQRIRLSQRRVLLQFLKNPKTTGIFDLATGFGKTRIMSILAMAYFNQVPNGKVIIVVPTENLIKDEPVRIDEYTAELKMNNFDIGFFYGKRKDTENSVLIVTYNSLGELANRINVEDVGLLLLDEGHHSVSENRKNTIRRFSNASQYAMTATPWYSPEKNLIDLLGETIAHVNISDAIREGDLADRCKSMILLPLPKLEVDLSDINKSNTGDYDMQQYEEAFLEAVKKHNAEYADDPICEDVFRQICVEVGKFYKTYEDEDAGRLFGQKCIISFDNQKKAKVGAEEINKLFGHKVAGVWTSDYADEKDLEAFKNGNLLILCQVGRLEEGFDMSNLKICINFPTCSRVRETQRIGRPLRKAEEGKMALIVDVVFKNPKASNPDNPIESAHLNRQVLGLDILRDVYICSGVTRQSITQNRNERTTFRENCVSIGKFSVVSNVHDLITLKKEAKAAEEAREVPDRQPGQMFSKDLARECSIGHRKAKELLERLNGQTIRVYGKDVPVAFVAKCSNGFVGVVLNNHPAVLDFFEFTTGYLFKSRHPELQFHSKRSGQLGIKDLCRECSIVHVKAKELLMQMKDETVEVNGQIIPVVVQIVDGLNRRFVLNDHPAAIEFFEKRTGLIIRSKHEGVQILPKKEGQFSARDLKKECNVRYEKVREIFETMKGKTVEVNGEQIPVIIEAISGSTRCFVLNGVYPEVVAFFEKETGWTIASKHPESQILRITDGQMTRCDIRQKCNVGYRAVDDAFEQMKEIEVDIGNGKKVPVITRARSGRFVADVLNGVYPEVIAFFEEKTGFFLTKQHPKLDLPEKRKGQKSIKEVAETYHIGREKVICIKDALKGRTFEVDETGARDTVFTRVRSGVHGPIVVLNDHPAAHRAFEEALKTLQNNLIQRTS